MMSRTCLLLLTLIMPVTTWAALDCMDSEYLVQGTFGVNPTATDLPPIIGLPGAEEGNLLQVQIQWLAMEDRERQNEVITVDYPAQTTTNVEVFDGSVGGIVLTDLRHAEIDPSSSSSRGQLNVNWCMPVGRTDGLIFAIYESGGALVGLQGSPFAVFDGATSTAVLNQAITNQMGLEFNTGGAEATREDIQAVTGVYPDRYLAEHIFQRDIPAMLLDELKNEVLFHNPRDGIVVGNMFLVAGANAGAYTPTSVTGVWRDGAYVLGTSKYVSDLDNKRGELSFEVGGQRRPAFVVEGRADLHSAATDCVSDKSTITASFVRPSPLHSVIELWKGGAVAETVVNDQLESTVTCDATYQVRGMRSIRGLLIDEESESFGLSSEPGVVSIDSFSVSPESVETGNSVTVSWTVSNATSCTAEDGNSAWRGITPDPTGGSTNIQMNSAGQVTFTLSCTDGTDTDSEGDSVSVDDPATFKITGVSIGGTTYPDSNSDGTIDTVFNIECGLAHSIDAIETDTVGDYTYSGSGPTGWSVNNGSPSFQTSCGDTGKKNAIATLNDGDTQESVTIQYDVLSEPQQFNIDGVTIGGVFYADADVDGVLDMRPQFACGTTQAIEIMLSTVGSYSSSFTGPSGFSLTGLTGSIDMLCEEPGNKDADVTITNDDAITRDLRVTYEVLPDVIQSFAITGLSIDANNVPEYTRSGNSIPTVIELTCGEAMYLRITADQRENIAEWIDNAPTWASVNTSGDITGTPSCETDLGSHNFAYMGRNADMDDTVDVTYLVNEEVGQTYDIALQINVIDNGQGFVQHTTPSETIIKKVWQTPDISAFIGTRIYDNCNASPGGAVNDINEINTNYSTRLTSAEQQEFSGDRDGFIPFVNDGDNDGLSCNPEEPDGQRVTRYQLTITQN